MTKKKSKLMRQVENQQGERLETLLPKLMAELGAGGAAAELGVSKATIGYWCLKMGLRIERVAVPPEWEVIIKRAA